MSERRRKPVRTLLSLVLSLALGALSLSLVACGSGPGAPAGSSASAGGASAASGISASARSASGSAPAVVRVASLKGPTSIGLVQFVSEARAQSPELQNSYDFSIVGTADEILPALVAGDLDIALLPANVASVLYNRTEGGIQALNINTLGVLYVVTADDTIHSLKDLSGRTVLMTGKGTTPEYVMSALLAAQNVADVTLEYKSEATELAAALAADPAAIAVLPQPYVAAVTAKNPDLKIRVSLSDEWDSSFSDGSRLVTGVTVVRADFAREHPGVVEEFCARQRASVDAVNASPATAAPLVVEAGIISSEAIAVQAIPFCSLVSIDGDEMKTALNGYLTTLFAQDPAAIGGALPAADFFYRVP
ncbi:MAG: ABC transporter substrate-binding protein [Coriobacteriales bacterium]|jgi:NitT/TauT family transport system substrate-binding protein|nr:ABC transporter substrate-binding protein [Coriobacteriales bacterium]